ICNSLEVLATCSPIRRCIVISKAMHASDRRAASPRPEPGFAPGEAGRGTRLPAPLNRPRCPFGLSAIQRELRRSAREERGLDSDRPAVEPRIGGKVKRLQELPPAQADVLVRCPDDFGTYARRRAFSRERCPDDR